MHHANPAPMKFLVMRQKNQVTGDFFTAKDTNGHEKISWRVRHILADKATSMKFFRVLSCFSLLKKKFSTTQLH
jgi:hypothetical protein